ncbi:unnamed protein product [Parnassius mnemosyne]|uniref:Mos1 transposase HTH domain-containing protein n=1 Tax=Parnassius mnemosyne TaxID=213953 RepID=A0AAV1MA44_9NEOP
MELTRENSRAMIYYDFRSGLTQKQCVDRMISAFGDEAPSKTTIYRWFAEFQRVKRVKLSDDPRQGHPKTVVTQENVDAVRKLIEEDQHVTYREIQATLDIDMSQIQIILHEQLGVKKLFSRWIPHSLCEEQKAARVTWCVRTLERFHAGSSNAVYNIVSGDESWIYAYEPETKNQSRVWVFENELKPTKIVRSRSVAKKWWPRLSPKPAMLRLFLLRDKERLMQNGMLAFVCHRSFLNSVKRTATAASSSITTMRVLTPHTEQKSF